MTPTLDPTDLLDPDDNFLNIQLKGSDTMSSMDSSTSLTNIFS